MATRAMARRSPMWVLLVPLVLSLATWMGVRASLSSTKPTLLLVGDSFTGNYRMDDGDRIQDLLAADVSKYHVVNLARPGARTLDMALQVHQAALLGLSPSVVVAPMFVSKFRSTEGYIRLDKRGDQLKWLELSRSGRFFASFDAQYKKKVLIHKIGLLFGFFDLAEHLYLQHVQWPIERSRMRKDPPARRAKIQKKLKAHAKVWEAAGTSDELLFNTGSAHDFELLAADVKARGARLIVVLIPAGNMDAARASFSDVALGKLEKTRRQVHAYLKRRNIEVVDVVDELPGRHYDDFTHMKTREGNAILARAVQQHLDKP
ncbi:MAG: SGNH/GDSL hydrolase family protein [Myxococcales bacterium]|nr:SGNH/GDSL hydrolase family protein [Myxococcales bacterium]